MTAITYQKQKGAVLFIALVMLLVLTLLAINSMRGVTLETRITANRAQETKLINVADAALREAEFRYYGPGNIPDKLEPKAANCSTDNTLNVNGINKPCLLAIQASNLLDFVNAPENATDAYLGDDSSGGLLWMPYRGTDAENSTQASAQADAHWNSIRAGEAGNAAVNAEYGMVAEGQGTYFYMNNGKAGETLFLQSTNANIYLGINN
ncbi:PilX N-terminal domain-containing pilus assembly protein [Pseudomonas sp. MDMC216]|nr:MULTISPECIES: PilX N-terminal domain-containing pilus assembly protein [Pseudomonas]MDI5992595.1 PilX N-terminal domain-containing pilus assembly protein [Pseudomonas sp. MDMC216]MDI6005653.1 PilX N-terminal domain-containing pilus assembly protein [Pseudomonas sp. MDMC17]RAR39882.1 pilus assembly protein PilX [Pseudomonas sp. MDMC224]TXR38746.1 pilus assembly protein PilX [Pseudomonas mendocina]